LESEISNFRSQVRYVVLHHTGIDQPHFDVMVETAPGGALSTWRAPSWPLKTGDILQELPPHRREYLDYEGPLSNNRGAVRRVAGGTWTVRFADDLIEITTESPEQITLVKDGPSHWYCTVAKPR